jgi:HSP20 family protein
MAKKHKHKQGNAKKSQPKESTKDLRPAGGRAPALAEGRGASLLSLREGIDRLFEDFVGRFPASVGDLWSFDFPRVRSLGVTLPAADLVEEDGSYRVTVELPGMEQSDVDVSVSGDMLTIRGEKREEREEKKKDRYLSERRFGSFRRSFRLPETVDRNKITASVKKGVLEVVLPKGPEARKGERRIPIGTDRSVS